MLRFDGPEMQESMSDHKGRIDNAHIGHLVSIQPFSPEAILLVIFTVRHGISLRTLIRKSSDLSGSCLLVTGDSKGAVFGGLLNCPLTPTSKRKYQGTYETFVFTTLYGPPRLFRPTGANRYFYMCLNDMLAIGGGGNFALCLDEDLLQGTSGSSETFGNQCLAHDEAFALKNVELRDSIPISGAPLHKHSFDFSLADRRFQLRFRFDSSPISGAPTARRSLPARRLHPVQCLLPPSFDFTVMFMSSNRYAFVIQRGPEWLVTVFVTSLLETPLLSFLHRTILHASAIAGAGISLSICLMIRS